MVARMLIAPPGALAGTELISRLAGIGSGVLVYFLSARRVGLAVLASVIIMVGVQYIVQ